MSRLKPGDYRLYVKGSNPDGVWNESGFEVGIQIVPPFWRTTWFAILALLFIASVARYPAGGIRPRIQEAPESFTIEPYPFGLLTSRALLSYFLSW